MASIYDAMREQERLLEELTFQLTGFRIGDRVRLKTGEILTIRSSSCPLSRPPEEIAFYFENSNRFAYKDEMELIV